MVVHLANKTIRVNGVKYCAIWYVTLKELIENNKDVETKQHRESNRIRIIVVQ